MNESTNNNKPDEGEDGEIQGESDAVTSMHRAENETSDTKPNSLGNCSVKNGDQNPILANSDVDRTDQGRKDDQRPKNDQRPKDDQRDGSGRSLAADELLTKSLSEILNDAGQFSYVALCSINLALLFEDQWNKDWKEKLVWSLLKHMDLPRKTGETMLTFMRTEQDKEHAAIFANGLLTDPCLTKPQLVPQDLISHALSKGQYDARSRVLALHIADLLRIDENEIHDFELTIVSSFVQQEVELSEEEQKEKQKRAKIKKVKRFMMIGAAAVGGGALIGLTGGLAAPLIASAGVALVGSSLGFLGTAAGIAILTSVFGAAGAGLTGYKMNKRVGAIEEFEFDTISADKDLHVVIAISGWLTNETPTYEGTLYDNFRLPWLTLASSKEVYYLRWESKYLLALGEALSFILNKVLTVAAKEALKMTVLAGLLVAFALPATAYSTLIAIDNPWSVVTNRSVEAGKQLAEVLLSRHQGKRPVTLIGFSMGARVIYFCLKELANRKGCEGIVQDAVLLGAPVPSTVKNWMPFARVVAGRIINGYCRGDWLLQFIYRAASVQMLDIAGLQPVKWQNRRMVNVDLTDIVSGHFDYAEKMDIILQHIGIKTKSTNASKMLLQKEATLPVNEKDTLPECLGASSAQQGDTEFAVIDASDLILQTGTVAPTQADILECTEEQAQTGSDGPELESKPHDQDVEVIGSVVAGIQESSITREGHLSDAEEKVKE